MVSHFATLLIALGLLAGPAAHASCSRVLVSGYYTSVHVYDGCDGTFVNATGVVQPFARAIKPPQGCKRDGQFFYELAELEGLYQSPTVLGMMAAEIDEFKEVYVPPQLPEHQH